VKVGREDFFAILSSHQKKPIQKLVHQNSKNFLREVSLQFCGKKNK
jgi:hypothetical protein